jgi:thiamine-monophosphate kinase
MNIGEIGGEFALIGRLAKNYGDRRVLIGQGDDCALLGLDSGGYLVTTDMMVEGDHFRLDWSSPEQIGSKLMESNVSDVVCKGGRPRFAFVSVCLTKETSVEFMDGLYRGIYASAERHGVMLLGGDTTHGPIHVFNLCLIGEAGRRVPSRGGARVGDRLCVTGELGGSTAGLKLLLKGKPGYLDKHLDPRSRLVGEGEAIARYASASIDVSDGLASETRHICERSGVGARIDCAAVPLSPETLAAGKSLGLDPLDFALYGGEDYEIWFTVAPADIPPLRAEFPDFCEVGEILPPEEGVFLVKDGRREAPAGGYDHFA